MTYKKQKTNNNGNKTNTKKQENNKIKTQKQ